MDRVYNTGASVQAQPDRPANPSLFGTLDDTTRTARDTAERVETFVNRLCGSVPSPPEGKPDLRASPNGLLEQGIENAASVRMFCERINGALERLERVLP